MIRTADDTDDSNSWSCLLAYNILFFRMQCNFLMQQVPDLMAYFHHLSANFMSIVDVLSRLLCSQWCTLSTWYPNKYAAVTKQQRQALPEILRALQ